MTLLAKHQETTRAKDRLRSRILFTIVLLLFGLPTSSSAHLVRIRHYVAVEQVQNFSVAGMGNADGSVIERLDYSSTGDFAGGGPGASSFFHDADVDLDLDLRDFASFQNCFGQTDPTCLAVHDFDTADVSDGDIDLDDYARLFECFRGPFVTPDQVCGQTSGLVVPPSSGTFGMHGRALDILSDGFLLQDFRARTYLPGLGRWLQRDPTGFADGANLYGSFRNNPLAFTDPFGTDALSEFFIGPAGKNLSFFDVIFSRETAADLTFGAIQTDDPIANRRRRVAFRQGVVSPTITAGEIALTGPAGGIRNFLLRNATVGVIFGTGEFGRDLLVEGRVQSLGEFAVNTAVFTGAGATLEGVFLVGGRVIALVRQGGRSTPVDVTTQLGQLIRQAEAESSMILAAAGRQQLALQQGASAAALRLQLNVASGELGELAALGLLRSRGETIIGTQFRQGAALRGFDSVSALQTPQGLRVFVNEVKASAGNIVPSRFSALGLNRASTFNTNLFRAQTEVQLQVGDLALREGIRQALLRRTFTVRLIGQPGIRITPRTAARIGQVTGTNEPIVILDVLPR